MWVQEVIPVQTIFSPVLVVDLLKLKELMSPRCHHKFKSKITLWLQGEKVILMKTYFFDNSERRRCISIKRLLIRMGTASWTTMSLSRWCCSIDWNPFLTGTFKLFNRRFENQSNYVLLSSYQGWDLGWSQVKIFLLLLHLFNKVSLQCLLMSIRETFIGLCP